jgi:hypothetical protein
MAWQRLAEIVGEYVRKGSKLYVEGKLQTSSWEDRQNGERKYRTEIVARDIVLLGAQDNGQERRGEMPSGQSSPEPALAVADEDTPLLSQEEICGNLYILVEPQTGTGGHRLVLPPSPRLSARPGAFLRQPRFEYAPIRRPHREEVAMRVFRANDKMSAKEPVSVTRGQGWDPIPSILPKGDTALPFVSSVGTVWRL